jgi:hypothetical protein
VASPFHRLERRLREGGADHAADIEQSRTLWSRLLRRSPAIVGCSVTLNPPASSSDLAAFEQRYSVTLPDDVIESYLHMDGTAEYTDLDTAWMRFLPIAEWRPCSEQFPGDARARREPFAESFVFADHGIAAWFFSIDLDPLRLGQVYSLSTEPRRVAFSFTDFVDQVLAGGDGLLR